MTQPVTFILDGQTVLARPYETIWAVATRLGTEIPHLCHRPEPGYRTDGNCRACMVEIAGERVLAAACIRRPTSGMVVTTANARVETARRVVFDLLLADLPERDAAPDPDAALWRWADKAGATSARFPETRGTVAPDLSHPAIQVRLDACIQCGLCQRACREVQGNDVIGMAWRGDHAAIVFDQADSMGTSTCVGCGECVQACPTGALLPKSAVGADLRVAATPDRTVNTLCPFCGVGCQTTVHVAGTQVLKVEGRAGPANENRLCVKGRFGWDYAFSRERLTRPLIRLRDAPKAGSLDGDPRERFREADWDEALDRAAQGFITVRQDLGPSALAGFGSAKGSNEEAYLFQKLVRTGFGTNNVDHCTRLCHASSVAALLEGIGSGAVTAPFTECVNSDVILVIGANPTVNHPVAATYIKQAARRGAKLVVIDPRGQALDRFAHRAVRFHPGADVALLNAILHVIVAEGLVDREFVAARVEDYDAFVAGLPAFTPEAMAPICGVPADDIRDLARLFGSAKALLIFWGMGISQHVHGTDNARALIALALITGNVGRPGAGLHPLRGQNNVQGASDAGLIPMSLPDYHPALDAGYRAAAEAVWGVAPPDVAGLTVVDIMQAAEAGRIRGLYVMGENPAMSDPDLNHARKALVRLDHLVVQDIFLTETAAFADVVLPATVHLEKDGTFTNTNRQVQMGRAVLPPPGEARADWRIIQALARRLGLGWDYDHPRQIFTEMARLMPSLDHITWDRLEREGSVTYPCADDDHPGASIIFGDRFPRANGLGRLVATEIIPPDERPDPAYPFVLTTGRVLEHWHTGAMTRRSAVLDALDPDATCHFAPADLERLGVAPGGWVRVETRRGHIDVIAQSEDGLPPGVLFLPFCYAEAAANLLTNPALDPDGKIPELKFCAARVAATAPRLNIADRVG